MPEEGSLFYGTDSYFEVFDFSIIPVEVISGIYESLIDVETRKLNSAVYTPSFLAEYILNDTVDKFLRDNNTADCKIFDPSVGSGVFLVQALRKMIDKEIELNGKLDKLQFSKRIREIAKNNLFGIDINSQALKVTCFSIYIALLDYQEPKEIDVYKFPNLIDENLFIANFFDEVNIFNEIIKNQKLDFILGNPPWKNGSKDKIHTKYLKKNNLLNIVSDYQLAQSFILRIKDFSKFLPICSLIITSKALYNNNAISFKRLFLKEFYLFKSFDLSSVRRLLFDGADNPAMILFFQHANNKNTFENIVLHQSLKYNIFLKYYKFIVLEKQDVKEIKQKIFYDNYWMFKVALYGNSLDFNFLKKILTNKHSINSVLKEKHSINAGNGIHKGTPKKYYNELIGFPIVETKNICTYYTQVTDANQILDKEDVFLEAGRNVELFKGLKILLTRRPKNESDINISYCQNDVVFRNSSYGIPFNNNKDTALYTFSLLISNLYTYYQYLTSSNWGIYYPEVNKTEYLSFPFIEPNEEKKKELVDLVNQFLLPYKEYYKEFTIGEPVRDELVFNKINDAINELYGVKAYEKDLIDYVLDVSRYQFQESKQSKFTKSIHTDIPFLEKYANVYVDEFSKIYPDEHLQIEVYPLEHFVAMNFVFYKVKPENNKSIIFPDKKDEKAILKRLANNLSISQITNAEDSSKNLYIQKDIKGFEENSFYIIKPNELKCWHRAMAWYDVAEFKDVIENAELNQLKGYSDGV